jgi:hypothetical protein
LEGDEKQTSGHGVVPGHLWIRDKKLDFRPKISKEYQNFTACGMDMGLGTMGERSKVFFGSSSDFFIFMALGESTTVSKSVAGLIL